MRFLAVEARRRVPDGTSRTTRPSLEYELKCGNTNFSALPVDCCVLLCSGIYDDHPRKYGSVCCL